MTSEEKKELFFASQDDIAYSYVNDSFLKYKYNYIFHLFIQKFYNDCNKFTNEIILEFEVYIYKYIHYFSLELERKNLFKTKNIKDTKEYKKMLLEKVL